MDRFAMTGVCWGKDGTVHINLPQFADIMNIKPGVLESHLISNGFVRSHAEWNQYSTWSKPGFARFPTAFARSRLRLDKLNHSAATQANSEFSELLHAVFHESEALSRADFQLSLFSFCPPFLCPTDILTIAFESDPVTISDFSNFYSHFGPKNSLVAKYAQFLGAKSDFPALEIDENNTFHFTNGSKYILVYNNPTKEVGEFFLYDGHGLAVDSWSGLNLLGRFADTRRFRAIVQ
jgi:hypothetical protein